MWRHKFTGLIGTAFTGSAFSLFGFQSQSAPPLDDLKLQSIQVFFRHGARTPLRPIPFLPGVQWPKELMANPPASPVQYVLTGMDGKVMTRSPHDDKLQKIVFPGGAKAGHLTTVGKQQMFDLGRRLRMEYIEKRRLLNPAYSESQVYVRSTNILRTVESAQWMVSGMFDAAAKGAKPVVIHTDLDEEEILYPNVNFCIALKNVNKSFYKWVDDMPGLEKSRLAHTKILNYTPEKYDGKKLDYQELRDELSAREANGLYIPPEAKEMWNQIDSHAIEMLKLMVSGPDEKKRSTVLSLSCGAVLHMVAANMDTAGQVTDSKKMFVYSAHDSLMMALLLTLGFFDGHWPPFAADIVFELYTDKQDKKWVRILFMGRPQKLGKEQGEIISYDKFKKLIAPFSLSYKKYRRVCDVQEVEGGEVMDVIGGRKK
ncbi:lysophosphatidic acid phosphatase type 6-like [Paramacrobiotus metropolitanus]|uniref:lysophosphatidic acid phosphatase type 6-like n=1 Tax=Paramacrobiotus metropolitanus TaxID=2943436 RepID=UPI002445B1E2|nr:lysophosphatidic acid phosphatase type 6-like [Paramacrobiotus metropolitanus]